MFIEDQIKIEKLIFRYNVCPYSLYRHSREHPPLSTDTVVSTHLSLQTQ